MQIAVDFHTHTIASGHYTTDTLTDLAKAANSAGLAYLAVTDHAFGLTNGAADAYFKGLKLVERKNAAFRCYSARKSIFWTGRERSISPPRP